MDYEEEMHAPNRIETLLQHHDAADVASFDHVLHGLKIMMKNHPNFLDGLKQDETKREQETKKLFKTAKETILTAFKDKTDEEGINIVHGIISNVEQAYNALELEYMNDVLTTCVSYKQDNDDRE